jgi:16S rRNA U516 pseudouridylate synthase RsuA-like enzyme
MSNDDRFGHDAEGPLASLTSDLAIKVQGFVQPEDVRSLDVGIVSFGPYTSRSTWLKIHRTRSSPSQIARALKGAGLEVLSWERRRLGPFRATDVNCGSWRRLDDTEKESLLSAVSMGLDDATPLDEIWDALLRKSRY